MTKLSQLISLPVFSIYEGKLEGTIENALLNAENNKIEFLLVYNEEDNLKKLVAFNEIYSISESGIAVKNSAFLNLYESMELKSCKCYNPINTMVFKVDGSYLGKVTDVVISKNKVTSFLINDIETDIKEVLSFNNSLTLIKSKLGQRASAFKLPEIKTKVLDTKVSIQSPSPTRNQMVITPKRAVVNYSFLINRHVTKDILSTTGEVLLKRDTLVTLGVINLAKQFGKLKELTLFSK